MNESFVALVRSVVAIVFFSSIRHAAETVTSQPKKRD
jgi:hypothetical protein